MSQTIRSATPRFPASSTPARSSTPLATPKPPDSTPSLSREQEQPGANAEHLNAVTNNFLATPEAGLGNRAVGISGDVATLSSQADLPAAGSWKEITRSSASQRAQKFLPFLNTVAAPINAIQGANNLGQGADKLQEGQSTAEKAAGAAQLGQGAAQVSAAGAGAVNLAAKLTPGLETAGAASGKLLLKTLGPAIAALEGGKNGAEAVEAYQQGDSGKAIEKGYSATMKMGGAGLMRCGPVGAAVGGGMILGTSIAEVLNQTKPVQDAQEAVADWLSGPQSLPAMTPAEREQILARVQARREAKAQASAANASKW